MGPYSVSTHVLRQGRVIGQPILEYSEPAHDVTRLSSKSKSYIEPRSGNVNFGNFFVHLRYGISGSRPLAALSGQRSAILETLDRTQLFTKATEITEIT